MKTRRSSILCVVLSVILIAGAVYRGVTYLNDDSPIELEEPLYTGRFLPAERETGEMLLGRGFEIKLFKRHILAIRGEYFPTWITDEELAEVAKLPKLESFALQRPGIKIFPAYELTDEGFSHLVQAQGLERLNLNFSNLTNEGLKSLSQLPQLLHLNIEGTKVTEAGLEHIPSFPKLQSLDLGNIYVSKETIEKLKLRPEFKLSGDWVDRQKNIDSSGF